MSGSGKVIPHTPLAVDFWKLRKCPGTRLFFLSHMHGDHTVGLTSTWSNRPIYCSPTTAILLRLKLQVSEQWIHPLEFDEPHLLPMDDVSKEKLVVTLIDANHCPGAAMFLFEGYFGSILYTGDFRYTPSMLLEPCLRTSATIDVLYLDNTNCDSNRLLPSREMATQQIKWIIRNHPDHNVVIGLYSLGKESLLLELAVEFKTWIEVSFERMEILKALKLPDVFTTERGSGRIRVVNQSEICCSALRQWNKEHPTLAILPTSRPFSRFHPKVHVVPYSDHSSYQELKDFVSAVKPTSLKPIVGNSLPTSLYALLPHKKRHEVLVPESVRHYMLNQAKAQLCSSSSHNPIQRHVTAFIPKGVVFDSPVRSKSPLCKSREETLKNNKLKLNGSEEDMDTDSSGSDLNCILVAPSTQITSNVSKGNAGNAQNLNSIQTVSEEVVMTKSVPRNHISQSHFDSMENLRNTGACLTPIRTTGEHPETITKIQSKSPQGHGSVQAAQMLSDDKNVNQQWDCPSSASFFSSTDIPREHVEELETKLLGSICFSEEELKKSGLLQQTFVRRFTLLPLKDLDEDDV